MYAVKPTLDDLMRVVLTRLLKCKNRIRPTKGPATELTGVLLKITQPRARLSRTEVKGKLFSCLGEFLWYLAGSDKLRFIKHYLKDYDEYSDDGETIYGAYGPRLFNIKGMKQERINQVDNVITLLRKKRHSRQAVIQLFSAADIAQEHKDVPCTCTMQFMVRRGRLDMFIYMRSNDAFIGLPHDVFAFTMLQEMIARTLAVELGTYNHAVGSLHLYSKDRKKAHQYINEGWQSTTAMPKMPATNPWKSAHRVMNAEKTIRNGRRVDIGRLRLDPYWGDLVRLLQIYSYSKSGNLNEIVRLKAKMTTRLYDPYIEGKRQRVRRKATKTLLD